MRAHLLDLNAGHPNRGTPALRVLLAAAGYEVEEMNVRGGEALPISDSNLWVLGGGPGSPMEPGPWREPLFAALRARVEADLPTLCICYGFECLGLAMGAALRELEVEREGIFPVVIAESDAALDGLNGAGAYERRRWGVFGHFGRVIARGPEGDVSGVRLGHRVLGVIFHPEADLGPETAAVYAAVVPRYLAALR
ncbi:hypothetical protein LBMAG42_34420 [Deltaproteobacteria bacterium]|nr:hypothetical protein LBMAG42_34420 [Deltaproteobacteria bacterium]